MSLAEMLKEYEQLSNIELEELAANPHDEEAVKGHLVSYIRYRFILVGDDYWNDDIRALSEYSIRKILQLQKDEPLDEISMSCTGATSSAERKVLLILALRKKLGIAITPDESVEIETVTQLAQTIASKLINKE